MISEKMKVNFCVVTLMDGGGGKDKTLHEEWLSGLVTAKIDVGF